MKPEILVEAFSSQEFNANLNKSWKKQEQNIAWQKLNELLDNSTGEDAEVLKWTIHNLRKTALRNIALTAYLTNDGKKEILDVINKTVNSISAEIEQAKITEAKSVKKVPYLRLVK